MGAIVYAFPSVPLDADADKVRLFQGIYADLQRLGIPLPATPANAITRADLITHLRAQAGALIKAELTANPDGLDYAGTDANTADVLHKPYTPPNVRRFPGSHLTGYQVVAGSTATVVLLATNPGLGNPGFLAMIAADPPLNQNVAVRFRLSASVVANRRAFQRVRTVNADNTLEVFGQFPAVPAVGDICDLGFAIEPIKVGRMHEVLSGFPHGPNALTAADVAGAKV